MAASLIVNADDFGLEEGINRAAIQAHESGVLTSVSLLATGNAFEHATALAREYPHLGVGAHLALTRGPSLSGSPVLGKRVARLTNSDGLFSRRPILLAARAAAGMLDLHEVKTELRAQIEKIASAGIRITHIDSHQHIHLMPSIFRIVLEIVDEFRVKWIRLPLSLPDPPVTGGFWGRKKQHLLEKLALQNLDHAKRRALRWADYHAGIEHAGRMQEEKLLSLIRQLPDALTEISCHPGMNNAGLNRLHPWNYFWEQELAALCSSKVRTAVEEANVRLLNYGDAEIGCE